MRKYLEITEALYQDYNISRPDQLFINMDGSPITKHQPRAPKRNIIVRADPFSLNHSTSFHSVRHVASTMIDNKDFTTRQILQQMQWKFQEIYYKYYCQLSLIEKSSRGCIIA